jgi:hypothetical protein
MAGFSRMRQRPRSERWEREDAAERLAKVVPALQALRLELRETNDSGAIAGTTCTRHISVATAGALFEVFCTGCRNGGFDLTRSVLAALESKQTQFEGECGCSGTVGDHDCDRILYFSAQASYN